jgi:hypothetical protein
MDSLHQIPVEEIQLIDFDKIQPDQIDDQIRVRYHLIMNVLVGRLYPAILADQIEKLKEMKNG